MSDDGFLTTKHLDSISKSLISLQVINDELKCKTSNRLNLSPLNKNCVSTFNQIKFYSLKIFVYNDNLRKNLIEIHETNYEFNKLMIHCNNTLNILAL